MSFYAERQDWERRYWRRLLARAENNITRASRKAGCTRQHVYRILQRLGIEVTRENPPHRGNETWRALGQ